VNWYPNDLSSLWMSGVDRECASTQSVPSSLARWAAARAESLSPAPADGSASPATISVDLAAAGSAPIGGQSSGLTLKDTNPLLCSGRRRRLKACAYGVSNGLARVEDLQGVEHFPDGMLKVQGDLPQLILQPVPLQQANTMFAS
jgi:hypothetical protein